MVTREHVRGRAKFSATVDAALLREVDRFVAEQPGLSRSEVVDAALRLWTAKRREQEMEKLYQPGSAEDDVDVEEWNAWRRIQRAAASERLFRAE